MSRLRPLLALLSATIFLQLGLIWVQGMQLHRQNQVLVAMHNDLQEIAEALDQLHGEPGQETESWSPSRTPYPRPHALLRVRQEPAPAEEDAVAKELRQSKESGEKAVAQAKQAQQKLSITEAAKRADKEAKLHEAENAWMKWVWGSIGLVVVAMLLRGWWRRRG